VIGNAGVEKMTQKRLLAVDDDVTSAELIVRVAERCGFEGFATSDSRGVTNLANALQPDLIAIDVNMPNIDARGLLALLGEANYGGQVLIVSGQTKEVLRDVQMFGREQGLSIPAYMQKPLDFQALRKLLLSDQLDVAA